MFCISSAFRDNIFNKDDNIYKSEALHKEGQTNERQQIKSFGLVIQEMVLMLRFLLDIIIDGIPLNNLTSL